MPNDQNDLAQLKGSGADSGPARLPAFTDVIVAVHGIGEQARFATVRSVATRLAELKALRADSKCDPVAPQPLGFFHSDLKKLTSVCLLDDAASLKDTDLATIGFAEVFWADIPQAVVKEGRTMEETKAWARTVVARADALCRHAKKAQAGGILPPDFTLAGEVLDEIIDTVYVLENLFFLAKKVGLFKFDLRRVLMEYLGDIQLVTEFSYYRKDIVGRFHRAMESIYQACSKQNPNVRIHIVAHSEGTVVSFIGLLQAMSKRKFIPENPPDEPEARVKASGIPNWLKQVRGYMTIGSPIDKHLLLWPRLWETLHPERANGLLATGQIQWRNYYDYGDPVGFKLDSARLWLSHVGCKSFQFCGCKDCHHDIGFARYLLPGEAHNEYWNDATVFQHFILSAVKPDPKHPPAAPADKWHVAWLSPLLPYLMSLLILAGGVFLLFKAMHAYTHPSLNPLQRFVRFSQLGVAPGHDLSISDLTGAILGLTALVAGATLLARLPRLALNASWPNHKWLRRLDHLALRKPRLRRLGSRFRQFAGTQTWMVAGLGCFLAGCCAYIFLVPRALQNEVGDRFWYLSRYVQGWGPTCGILGLAAVLGLLGYILMSLERRIQGLRRMWIMKGMRPLILCGGAGIALIVVLQLHPPNIWHLGLTRDERNSLSTRQIPILEGAYLSSNELRQIITARPTNWMETIEKVGPILAVNPPIWPVALAGVAFLYLWWLASLVFDLAFVWHRYIRHSVTNDRLREWNPYGFSRRWGSGKSEPCCIHPRSKFGAKSS